MLVVPLPPPPATAARRRAPLRLTAGARTGLIVWAAIGLGVLAGVPAARGDATLGATLPFWLVAAPLIGLAWRERSVLAHALRAAVRCHTPAAAPRRQARRLPLVASRRSPRRAGVPYPPLRATSAASG